MKFSGAVIAFTIMLMGACPLASGALLGVLGNSRAFGFLQGVRRTVCVPVTHENASIRILEMQYFAPIDSEEEEGFLYLNLPGSSPYLVKSKVSFDNGKFSIKSAEGIPTAMTNGFAEVIVTLDKLNEFNEGTVWLIPKDRSKAKATSFTCR
ncbi:MAG: hypothetical protein AB7G93_03320 [Bdellovibrionales bacterium]